MKTPIKIIKVEEAISMASGISIKEMRNKGRIKSMVDARMGVWYMCHDFLGYSYILLGKIYNRHHTTIMNGVKKIRKDDIAISRIYSGIRKICPEVLERKQKSSIEDWDF